jgi:hypothetical protein
MACGYRADQTSRLATPESNAPERPAAPAYDLPMEELPVVQACSLSAAELREQLGRYASAGRGAEVIEHDRRRRVVRVSSDVPESLILRLIEIERGCCPFFALAWDGASRRLAIEVPDTDHEPALEAIVSALGAAQR